MRLRWIAIGMGVLALVAWVGVIVTPSSSLGAGLAARHDAPLLAAPPPDAAIPDAAGLDGTIVQVAFGVRFRVPLGYAHERVDKDSIVITRPDLELVIGVSSGPRLKALVSPVDGVVALAKGEQLRVVSITTEGPERTLGKLEGISSGRPREAVLFIITAPTYRVAVFMRADGPHDAAAEHLIDEIVHGQRLLLP